MIACRFLALLFVVTFLDVTMAQNVDSVHFANGFKVGEVSSNSAIVWVRLTQESSPRFEQLKIYSEGWPISKKGKLSMTTDVVPGREGQVMIEYSSANSESKKTDWVQVSPSTDFTHQFELQQLAPATTYSVKVLGRANANSDSAHIEGTFTTAPAPAQTKPVRFIVSTCQAIRSIDSGPEGHIAYHHMLKVQPDFFVHTGDILYYDKVPFCKNVAQARAKWALMFGYGYNQRFHQNVPSFFMKDDHDTLKNDCWPGQSYGDLTFDQGLKIFREQVPMGEKTYRTFTWGKDVQVWLTENRDFRSANNIPDGPEKTILGIEQKEWLKRTISESKATFKFVISPGPLVGPDKRGKRDNHSNDVFAHEGQELRDFLSAQVNTYVICGDRHWQYCSKDPKTGLIEFGCGPINDEHKFGGTPGEDPKMHRYFSPKGGFLLVSIDGDSAKAEWMNISKDPDALPSVGYAETLPVLK